MVMGNIIEITNQVLFKLSKVILGSDGIIALKYGELLDSIFWNGMGSTCYWEKSRGLNNSVIYWDWWTWISTNKWWISERDWSPKYSRFLQEVYLFYLSLINLSGSGRGLNNWWWFLRVEILGGMLDSGVARWIEF